MTHTMPLHAAGIPSVGETINRYGRQLFSFIRNRVRVAEDAEDILQDVWHQFSRLTSLESLESTSAWLYAVARNRITDFYRKKKNSALEDYTYEDESGHLEIREIFIPDASDSPEFAMFKEAFWHALMEALDELPEKQREVFIQNELEDKTLQRIADEQGENIKTIISRKGYATKHIRARLQPFYDELGF